MRERKVFDSVEAKNFTEREVLKPGGYICKIMDVKLEETKWGEKLTMHVDIVEGESKGYYQRRYDNKTDENEQWKGNYRVSVPNDDGTEDDTRIAARFKTFIRDVEESNTGFHWDWDERKLKSKFIGILFNEKEWSFNGKSGFFTNPRYTTTVQKIKDGKFKIPPTQYLNNKNESTPAQQGGDGFINLSSGTDEELPFN